ncbi:hypothetical protein WJX73_006875 [Symbiochloris irregularis]|uniref:cellulase n=1 Tax=Symbiochloris irregularis TaxID=706552 RepID=A0AAW1NEW1_9CHLO
MATELRSRRSAVGASGWPHGGRLAETVEDEDIASRKGQETHPLFEDDSAESLGIADRPANSDSDYNRGLLDTASTQDPKRRYGGYRRQKLRTESSDDEEEQYLYTAAPFNQPDLEAMSEEASGELPVQEQPIYPKDANAALAAGVPYQKYHQRRKVNWLGCLVLSLYMCSLGFYIYIRVTRTLDLGSVGFIAFGVYVFAIEMLGAVATLLYGVNLIWDPVKEQPSTDPLNEMLPLVGQHYHLRVLIPCYKEPLAIVSKTISAAHQAALPNGCQRDIYMQRASGEVNGKSGNLNNCLSQIYPAGMAIPAHEVVCIFDADQVANADFFLKTLYLFDGGSDVGMVLSPQAFHNVRLNADVFNHANIQFWEYAQHGYDALGFISCTGTNFMVRSLALQQCGWSPTYTLTEDFALGMALKSHGWHCRYVEEYLAIGEAPDQVRNCFQQRSRWAKGHFQVVFSWKYCPLFVRNLPFLHRLLYCSGVFSYIVGAVTTPTFIIIPLLTIWVGIFPIVVSRWAAIALTAYAVGQMLVLSYCRRLKHLQGLWFAGIANNILWWAFAKAAFNALAAKLGRDITFKATVKGTAAKIVGSIFGDLWPPALLFIAGAVSFGIGLAKLISGPSVISTLAISLAWIVYGMIPPFLLLHYTFLGRGSTLAFWSKMMTCLSFLSAAAALTLLWFVYPKDFDFGKAAGDSLLFYDAQRVGKLPANNPISFRQSALQYENDSAAGFPDLTGGWLQGGIAGDLKLTMPTAFAVTMLAWGLLAFPSGYESAGQTAHVRQTVRWGTDYLLKTVRPAARNNSAVDGYNIVYQVGNLTEDIGFWGTPESLTAENMPRPAYTVRTRDGASDLASSLAAAFVAGSLALRADSTPDAGSYADQLMANAKALYTEAKAFPGQYTSRLQYSCTSKYSKSSIGTSRLSNPCPSPTAFANGSAVFFYNSTGHWDDLIWAAAWMFKATGNQSYLADVNSFLPQYRRQEQPIDLGYITDWNHVFQAANVLLAVSSNDLSFHRKAQVMLQNWICALGGTTAFTPQGRAWNPLANTTGATGNVAFLAAVYGQHPSSSITPAQSARYICFARSQMRYILGDKTDSLMVGNGRNPPTHVQNRAASCPDPPTACNAASAFNVTTPNPHVLTGAVVEFGSYSDSFQDVRTNNDSRVSVENNAGITGALAGLVNAPGTFDSCLQGFGVLTSGGDVCDASSIVAS